MLTLEKKEILCSTYPEFQCVINMVPGHRIHDFNSDFWHILTDVICTRWIGGTNTELRLIEAICQFNGIRLMYRLHCGI